MNFTSKSRYALKIMMDLAYHQDLPHVHRRDIVARQGIPKDYLDQIMIRLRRGGLVESVRGRGGGYRLGKPADSISLLELFRASEGHLEPVRCISKPTACGYDVTCLSKPAWETIHQIMAEPLQKMSLADLTYSSVGQHQLCPVAGVRECRGV